MMLVSVLELILGIFIVVLAFLAINVKSLIKTVMFLSAMSMLSVLAFVMMHAPDVAVTEAVIGSGLVTSLFVFTLLSVRKVERKQ
ncbi:hydrogenase subunit MbhD domain-containing protein [Candidatus Xianfuyuplasma coldseepsis]|nr:hydrogenase subunit MbhD domain-containing protein [Xianfuyuplasma coldseepsis]